VQTICKSSKGKAIPAKTLGSETKQAMKERQTLKNARKMSLQMANSSAAAD
jgi:hypothetical protein